MKKTDVPQDAHPVYAGETKVLYARNEQGKLETVPSAGWEVEAQVLEQALAEIARLTADALQRARAGQTAPLEYHMYRQRMDVPMLASASGRFRWQVRRDFDPRRFARLSARRLQAYAEALGIDVETLTRLPE